MLDLLVLKVWRVGINVSKVWCWPQKAFEANTPSIAMKNYLMMPNCSSEHSNIELLVQNWQFFDIKLMLNLCRSFSVFFVDMMSHRPCSLAYRDFDVMTHHQGPFWLSEWAIEGRQTRWWSWLTWDKISSNHSGLSRFWQAAGVLQWGTALPSVPLPCFWLHPVNPETFDSAVVQFCFSQ